MAKTRSLESIDQKLFKGSSSLQATIERLLEAGRPISVLEIGCGAGRALMELVVAFRGAPVTFYAINKEPGHPLSSSADLVRVARQYGLDLDGDGAECALPELFFYDATTLHFPDHSIDLIYLSSVARFIADKAQFIEEVCRVLKPGGVALIQMSKSGWDYPAGPARDDLIVTPYPSRLVLTYGCELVPLPQYLKQFAKDGFEFEFISAPACVIRVTKHRAGTLDLGLEYDPLRSVPMMMLAYGADDLREARGGFRSVYRVSDAGYRAMRDSTNESIDEGEGSRNEEPRSSGGVQSKGTRPKRPRAITCYRVGQRVKVKGKRGEGRFFQATKIRPNDDGLNWEELEGGIEWVDAATGTFGLLGCTVWVDAAGRSSGTWERVSRGELARGTVAKVSGSFRDGRFAPQRLVIKEPHAVIVEEIQGAISAIDAASACMEVAGFTVRVDDSTRIVTE